MVVLWATFQSQTFTYSRAKADFYSLVLYFELKKLKCRDGDVPLVGLKLSLFGHHRIQ